MGRGNCFVKLLIAQPAANLSLPDPAVAENHKLGVTNLLPSGRNILQMSTERIEAIVGLIL